MELDPKHAGDQTSQTTAPTLRAKGGSLPEFDAFAKILLSSMKEVSEIAEKGVSTFLLALGTVILLLILFMKFRPLGVQVADVEPTEFIFVLIVGALFIFLGTYLRLYQYRKEYDISRSLTDTGSRLIEKTVEASIRIQDKGLDAAKDMAAQGRSDPTRRI